MCIFEHIIKNLLNMVPIVFWNVFFCFCSAFYMIFCSNRVHGKLEILILINLPVCYSQENVRMSVCFLLRWWKLDDLMFGTCVCGRMWANMFARAPSIHVTSHCWPPPLVELLHKHICFYLFRPRTLKRPVSALRCRKLVKRPGARDASLGVDTPTEQIDH